MWRMRDINVTPTLKPKVKLKLCSKASGHKFRHQSIKIPTSIDGKPKGGGENRGWRWAWPVAICVPFSLQLSLELEAISLASLGSQSG